MSLYTKRSDKKNNKYFRLFNLLPCLSSRVTCLLFHFPVLAYLPETATSMPVPLNCNGKRAASCCCTVVVLRCRHHSSFYKSRSFHYSFPLFLKHVLRSKQFITVAINNVHPTVPRGWWLARVERVNMCSVYIYTERLVLCAFYATENYAMREINVAL